MFIMVILLLFTSNIIFIMLWYKQRYNNVTTNLNLEEVLSSNDEAIIVYNDNKIIFVNEIAEKLLHFEHGKMIGLKFSDIISSSEESDFWSVAAGIGDEQYYDITLISSELIPINTVAKASYFKDKKDLNVVLNIKANNLLELNNPVKNNLTFYLSIINHIDSMIIICDREGNVKIANQVTLEFLKSDINKILGKKVKDLLPMLSYELSKVEDVFIYSKELVFDTVEVTVNNKKCFYSIKIFPVSEYDGDILVKVDDVTNFINLESFISNAERLISTTSQIGYFNLKLKNELSVIASNIYLLKKNVLDDNTIKKFDKIDEAIDELSKISENISYFTQGNINQYNKEKLSIDEILDYSIHSIQTNYDYLKEHNFDTSMIESNITSNTSIDSNIAQHIQQVITNVIMYNYNFIEKEKNSDNDNKESKPLSIRLYDNDEYLFFVVENRITNLENGLSNILTKKLYETDINENLPINVSNFIVNHFFKGEISIVSNENKTQFIVKFVKDHLVTKLSKERYAAK